MRSSRPIPSATVTTSAPSSSETLAISLMNEIFVARKAFEASLIISALATSARRSVGAERRVQRLDAVGELLRALVGADHDAVRLHEVLDRRALLEELRVRDVARAGAAALDRAPGADRHGALHHERMVAGVAELLEHRLDAREVGVARVRGRGVDAHEQEPGVLEHRLHVGREVEPLGVLRHQLRQARLVDRHLPAAQRLDLLRHDVARPDLVSELREAGSRHEADPADPDDPDRFACGVHAGEQASGAAQQQRRTERAMPIICFVVSVWSSVFEIQ